MDRGPLECRNYVWFYRNSVVSIGTDGIWTVVPETVVSEEAVVLLFLVVTMRPVLAVVVRIPRR